MKKNVLLLVLCSSFALCSVPAHAHNPDTIRLARALLVTGIAIPLTFEAGRLAYKGGYFKTIKDFCKERPWWAAGGALVTTAGALLCKDAAINLVSPIIEAGTNLFARK